MLNKKEIWLLLDTRSTGGIETHVYQLAMGLTRIGISTKVIFLTNYGQHPLKEQLESNTIPYEVLDGKISTLYKRVKENREIVLHTHGYKSNIYGRFVSTLLNIASVSTHHAGDVGTGKLYIYGMIDRYTAMLSNKNYSVSKEIDARIPAATEILDNFINTEGLAPSNGKNIAFVGRLSKEKGPDLFVDLARRMPQATFYIYGDGPERQNLQEEKTDNVVFCGGKKSMDPYWSEIDILIMPSRQEGLPLSALEAMARGIPVLATNVGQLGNLINHGADGWLIPPNSTQHLVDVLQQWFEMDSIEKADIKRSAQEKIENRYSANIVIPQIFDSYNEIAKW